MAFLIGLVIRTYTALEITMQLWTGINPNATTVSCHHGKPGLFRNVLLQAQVRALNKRPLIVRISWGYRSKTLLAATALSPFREISIQISSLLNWKEAPLDLLANLREAFWQRDSFYMPQGYLPLAINTHTELLVIRYARCKPHDFETNSHFLCYCLSSHLAPIAIRGVRLFTSVDQICRFGWGMCHLLPVGSFMHWRNTQFRNKMWNKFWRNYHTAHCDKQFFYIYCSLVIFSNFFTGFLISEAMLHAFEILYPPEFCGSIESSNN